MSLSDFIRSGDQAGFDIRDFTLTEFKSDADEVKTYTFIELIETPAKTATEDYSFLAFDEKEKKAVLTLAEAKEKAAKVLEAARRHGERICNDAEELRREAEQIRNSAHQEGFEAGHREGLAQGTEEGRRQFQAQAEPALAAFSQVQGLYEELWNINEPAMVQLVLSIAEKVIFREVQTSPEVIKNVFKAALDNLQEQHQAVFRVNPQDLGMLEELQKEIRDHVKGLLKITLESDDNLSRGDLIMETESGRLDATMKTRLQAVVNSVEDVLVEEFDLDW